MRTINTSERLLWFSHQFSLAASFISFKCHSASAKSNSKLSHPAPPHRQCTDRLQGLRRQRGAGREQPLWPASSAYLHSAPAPSQPDTPLAPASAAQAGRGCHSHGPALPLCSQSKTQCAGFGKEASHLPLLWSTVKQINPHRQFTAHHVMATNCASSACIWSRHPARPRTSSSLKEAAFPELHATHNDWQHYKIMPYTLPAPQLLSLLPSAMKYYILHLSKFLSSVFALHKDLKKGKK